MKCGIKANIEYIWSNERKYACLVHAEQIEAVGQAIGMSTNPRMVITDILCPNELSAEEIKEREND